MLVVELVLSVVEGKLPPEPGGLGDGNLGGGEHDLPGASLKFRWLKLRQVSSQPSYGEVRVGAAIRYPGIVIISVPAR